MSDIDSDFGEFWRHYPRKVGKLSALKAYARARKQARAEEILAGVDAYISTMPEEVRFRPHPATWLNGGRWLDEFPEKPRRQSGGSDWFTECRQLHSLACGGQYNHAIRMDVERMKREAS